MDEPKRDEVAITVVRNIIAMHEGSREITVDDAAKTVRRAIDKAVRSAATDHLDAKMREIEQAAAADLAKKTDEFALAVTPSTDVAVTQATESPATESPAASFTINGGIEPAPESPNSPEEIRGRLLDWLCRSRHRHYCLDHNPETGIWSASLSVRRTGSAVFEVCGRAARLNHLDAIEEALDEVGADEDRGTVPVGSAS